MSSNLSEHLEKLRYFAGLEERDSLKAAASRMGVTQGALSKSIISLEDTLGVKLISRSHQGVLLTQEGLKLIDFSRKVLKESLLLQTEIRGTKAVKLDQSIRMGVYDSIAVYFLPSLNQYVSQIHPGLKIKYLIKKSADLLKGMEQNLIDMAVGINLSSSKKDLKTEVLFGDKYAFYIHPSKERALTSLPLIWLPEAKDSDLLSCQDHLSQKVGKRNTIDCENMETIKELTLSGQGIGVMPTRVANGPIKEGRLKSVKVGKLPLSFGPHEVTLLYNKENQLLSSDYGLISDILNIAHSTLS